MHRLPGTRLGLVLAGLALAALPLWADAPAKLKVKVPADAKLTIQGAATRQTGAERTFQSPTLPDGKTFTYKLKATWIANGKPVTVEKEVDVTAGAEVAIDLREASAGGSAVAAAAGPGKTRHFFFTYDTTVTGLEPGKTARIWLPVPPSNEDQEVTIAKEKLPATPQLGSEPKYGNKILYLEAKAGDDGTIPLSVTYEVKRKEVKMDAGSKVAADEAAKFLKADKMVPVGGKALALLEGKQLPMDQLTLGRALYDAVDDHVKYSKEGTGWGRGDVEWVCDSRFGNCTDFHSLFISLARAKNMPAKFEMGFPLPEKRGRGDVAGYHCWAKFKPQGRGWIPVDISEADKFPSMKEYYFGNLTEDRVAFTTGRDIDLVPKQDGEPLNFFVYPYVEVDGKPAPADKVKRKFSFEDAK
jgi:uncharacterized protein (TIGR03000 family)